MIPENTVTSDSEDHIIGDTTHGSIRNGGRNTGRGRRGRQFPPGFALLSFPSLENTLDSDWMEGNRENVEASELLGNDFVFFTAFLTAFLFNWIGFLLLMCFCHTIAARYVFSHHIFKKCIGLILFLMDLKCNCD